MDTLPEETKNKEREETERKLGKGEVCKMFPEGI
jgi:hypothetical protein